MIRPRPFPEGWRTALVLAILAVAFAALAVHLMQRALDLPRVHVSSLSNECVRVDDPAAEREGRDAYTCSNLPETYEVVWVH